MATKRKASALSPDADEPVDPSDELAFYCLGGGNEVGRSCHIIQYKGKTVMLDAGIHPAYDGFAALPFFDEFDLGTVDVLLISHFHLDHASSLPYVLAKTNFRGRVFMTHATKAIYKWLIQDSVRVSNTSSSAEQRIELYNENDHLSTFPLIASIDYNTTHTISSIRITPYPAGHVLGAAMFLVEIAGLKILFTGDYSRELDRHLIPAEVPKGIKIDVLITESTFGVSGTVPRVERETALMKSITSILNRGGRVLMPVFALGRAQELLLILDEYWSRHPEYQKIPIYYASNLARKCMVVYNTFISSMNDNIRRRFRERMAEAEASHSPDGANKSRGPWDFSYIRSLRGIERFDDVGGCVILANPGMLQNGPSRALLERWAPSDKNGVIMTGYSVEGTMARTIMNEPDSIPSIMSRAEGAGGRKQPGGADAERVMIPRRCSVQEISFAAHVSGVENREFIEEINAPVVILVHGEKHNMLRLKSKLLSLNASKPAHLHTKVYSPQNCEELRIPFHIAKTAKVVGSLAQTQPPKTSDPEDTRLLSGVLVQNGFNLSLMAPEDLKEYAGLTTTTIMCKQHLTLGAAGIDLVKWALESTFGAIEVVPTETHQNGKAEANGKRHDEEPADEEISMDDSCAFLVMGCVTVRYDSRRREVELEWEGNMVNDGIADAVMCVLLSVETSPAAVKYSSAKNTHNHAGQPPTNPHAHTTPEERLSRLLMILEAQFGAENITPLSRPNLPAPSPSSVKSEDVDFSDAEAEELERLHALGIPVPGLEIRVDKQVARVWLETLEVECKGAVLKDRVAAVVERAVETVSPLWSVVERPKKI